MEQGLYNGALMGLVTSRLLHIENFWHLKICMMIHHIYPTDVTSKTVSKNIIHI